MSGEPWGAGLRIGDAERDLAATALGEHFAAGRLDSEEYDDRVGRAWVARTRADLPPLFDDLPGGAPERLRLGPAPVPPATSGAPSEHRVAEHRVADHWVADHWVADRSVWQERRRSVTSKASTLPVWLLVVVGIVLIPLAFALVSTAMPLLIAGALAWFFLAGPGRSSQGSQHRGGDPRE